MLLGGMPAEAIRSSEIEESSSSAPSRLPPLGRDDEIDKLSVYLMPALGEAGHQGQVTPGVDPAGHPLGIFIEFIQSRGGKNAAAAGPGQAEPDIVLGFILVEGSEMVVDGHPLGQLPQGRMPEALPQSRLAHQNYLQERFLISLQVG